MLLEKFTLKLQTALAEAQSIAVGRDHQYIDPVHLVVALINQKGGTVHHLLVQADVNVPQLRSELGKYLDSLPTVVGNDGEVHISTDLSKLFNRADQLAQKRGDKFISSEIVTLAAIDSKHKVGVCSVLLAQHEVCSTKKLSLCVAVKRSMKPQAKINVKRLRIHHRCN